MSNSYKYIDPDYTYTDPKTGLLRNLQDITASDVLLFVESSAETKQFFPTSYFDNGFRYIDQLIEVFKKIPNNNSVTLGCLNGWQCRAELRNDTPLNAKK
jgi:cell filamentation protein